MTLLANIAQAGLPINSHIRAVQEMNERMMGKTDYEQNALASAIAGRPLDALSGLERQRLGYIVQTAIKYNGVLSDGEIIEQATADAIKLIEAQPWIAKIGAVRDVEELEEGSTTVRKRKNKKGAKQKDAEQIFLANKDKTKAEIIDLLTEALGKKTTATTYFYTLRKKYGGPKSGKRGRKSGGKSKTEMAVEIFDSSLDKSEMIDILREKLETTTAGATTYYYAAKKKAAN